MYAGVNPSVREMLEKENANKFDSLEQADVDFQKSYGESK